MPVDFFSRSVRQLSINNLRASKGEVELARLNKIPRPAALWAKAVFKSTSRGSKTDWFLIETTLYVDDVFIDKAWCNVFTHDAGATTVALQGTIIGLAHRQKGQDSLVSKLASNSTAYLRTRPNGFSWEISNIWIMAMPVFSLVHNGAVV
jgi:hypothetical protein